MNDTESNCPHNHTIGDNYGETCAVCGAQLAGYGYWATFPTCKHYFQQAGDEPDAPRVCIYCEQWEDEPDVFDMLRERVEHEEKSSETAEECENT